MNIRMIALAIPAALGIACSHSSQAAKDHTGAMWSQREKDAQAAMEQQEAVAGTSNVTVASMQADGSQGGSTSGSTPDTGGSSAGSQGQGSMSGSGSSPSGSGSSMSGSSGGSDTGSAAGESESSAGAAGQSESGGGPAGMGKSSDSSASSGHMAGMKSGKKGAHRVMGKISDVSSDSITIAPKKGEAKTLKISPDTKVTMNGKTAQPTDLKQGTSVRASYSSSNGEDTATHIWAGKSGHHARSSKGASGGTGMSGGGSQKSSGENK